MGAPGIADVAVASAVLLFAAGGAVASTVDLRTHRLPNRLLGAKGVGVALPLLVATIARPDASALVRALSGAAGLFVGYLALALVTGQLGLGDVKLAAIIGLLTGWFGWQHVLVATVAGFVLAGFVALGLLAARRAALRDHLPLGPFMVLGALIGVINATTRPLVG